MSNRAALLKRKAALLQELEYIEEQENEKNEYEDTENALRQWHKKLNDSNGVARVKGNDRNQIQRRNKIMNSPVYYKLSLSLEQHFSKCMKYISTAKDELFPPSHFNDPEKLQTLIENGICFDITLECPSLHELRLPHFSTIYIELKAKEAQSCGGTEVGDILKLLREHKSQVDNVITWLMKSQE